MYSPIIITKDFKPLKKSYWICGSPRTGSNVLCDILRSTNVMGKPEEYFSRYNKIQNVFDQTTDNGVFGVKVFWFQFNEERFAKFKEKTNIIFPNNKYVFLYREDTLRQAISYVRADQTGKWRSSDIQTKQNEEQFDYLLIKRWKSRLEDWNNNWENYFKLNQIEPLRLSYEQACKDWFSTAKQVTDLMDVEVKEFTNTSLEIQSDDLTEKWVEMFLKKEIDNAQ